MARTRRPRPAHTTAADLDPGLQPERTTMAWSRTGLALVAVSAVLLRWTPHYGPHMAALPVVTGLAAMVVVATQRRRTTRAVTAIRDGAAPADPAAPLLMVGLVLAVSVAALVLVALDH